MWYDGLIESTQFDKKKTIKDNDIHSQTKLNEHEAFYRDVFIGIFHLYET